MWAPRLDEMITHGCECVEVILMQKIHQKYEKLTQSEPNILSIFAPHCHLFGSVMLKNCIFFFFLDFTWVSFNVHAWPYKISQVLKDFPCFMFKARFTSTKKLWKLRWRNRPFCSFMHILQWMIVIRIMYNA